MEVRKGAAKVEDKKVVCAADIGHGNSKYVRFVTPEGEIRYELFPSVAPQAAHSPVEDFEEICPESLGGFKSDVHLNF